MSVVHLFDCETLGVPMVRDGGRAPYFLLDRGGVLVHIVNDCLIFPYKSWIYKVNETFCS
jgi:hypothetical protein